MSQVAAGSVTFLGAQFDLVSPPDVIETIRLRRADQTFRYVVTASAGHIAQLSRNPELRPAHDGAWLRLCDSHAVRTLGRLLGIDLPCLPRTDLMARILQEVQEAGDRVAVVGASDATIAALRSRYPRIDVVARRSAPDAPACGPAVAEAVESCVRSKARYLLLVGDASRAELLAQAISARPDATGTALCIGDALEALLDRPTPARGLRPTLEWIHGLAGLASLAAREMIGGGSRCLAPRIADARPAAPARARPLVLHITGDYPDPMRAPTTQAVKRLIDNATDADHVVFSLDRKVNPLATYLTECPAPPGQRRFAYGEFGLPFGIGLFARFWNIANQIGKVLDREGLRPDVVHAHRLTYDGIAGWLIARRLGIPLIVSVRGEVESKVFRFKPLYRRLMRRIASDAARIYYVSAWYREDLERLTGADRSRSRLLPNAVANCTASIEPREPEPAIVTVANLDIWRKKGVNRLIEAFARFAADMPGVRLDIVGPGGPGSIEAVQAMIDRTGLADRIRLIGQMRNCELIARLPSYMALALPSRNETFGMVYAEALFAGVPILYSRHTGIDGYLDGLDVGIGVDPNDIAGIGHGLVRLVRENKRLRSSIVSASGELCHRLCPMRHAALYQADIAALVCPQGEALPATAPARWHITIQSDWRPLEAEWRRLEEEGTLTAFQRYDWAAAWYASTLGHGRAEPVIVVVRESPERAPLLILPLARYRSQGVTTIGFADIRIADYAAPVMAKGLQLTPADARLLCRRIVAALPEADLLHLAKLVPAAGATANPLMQIGPTAPHLFMAHAVPVVAGSRDQLSARLGRKLVTDLQRKRRILEGIGPVRIEARHGPDALALFAAMERQHAERFGRLGRNDVLADPVWRDVYVALLSGAHGRPAAVMLALHAGDELMATAYGIIHDGRFLMLVIGLTSGRCDNASPGLQLVAEGLSWAEAEGLEAYDLTVGDEPYKQLFKPVSTSVYETVRPLAWRGLHPALTWRVKVWLRRHPRLRDAMKKLLRRA